MTRDEAIKIAESCTYGRYLVDALVALGVLKLDEPESAERKAMSAIWDSNLSDMPQDVIAVLTAAGLKIVEK